MDAFTENDGFHSIYINTNGRGSMYGINNHGNIQDTQGRGWYIKNDILYFSRYQNKVTQDMFTIDQYPKTSDSVISLEYDTITVGTNYMVLNGMTYRKLK